MVRNRGENPVCIPRYDSGYHPGWGFSPARVFMNKPSSNLSPTHLALLRGINVGGKNKLPMKDLVEMFVAAGCADLRTYIQSGNIIFTADPRLSAQLCDLITKQIATRFGYRTPVVLRTAKQLRDVFLNNPFLEAGEAEETLHVLFLGDLPTPDRVAGLDPDRSPPDTFIVRGQEVYLRLPNGVAKSKLINAYFDSKLSTTSTGRNWRAVTKLHKLMEG
jgi:uncharacterized protein (DUF1697 family)